LQFLTPRPHDITSQTVVTCQYLGNLSLTGVQTQLSAAEASLMAPSMELPADIEDEDSGSASSDSPKQNGHVNGGAEGILSSMAMDVSQ
jgi:hypothetical protein